MPMPDLSRVPAANLLVIHGILIGFVRSSTSDDLAYWIQLEADDERCSRIFSR